jgi:hypothetical protein
MEWLSGRKTYAVALAMGLLAAARHLGYIDDAMAQTLLLLLTGGGFAALRSAVKPLDQSAEILIIADPEATPTDLEQRRKSSQAIVFSGIESPATAPDALGSVKHTTMLSCLLAVAVLATDGVAMAAPPKAEISGKAPAMAGDVCILEATSKGGEPRHCTWTISPEISGATQLVELDQGRRCVVATRPGTITIRLVMSNADGHSLAERVLTIAGPTPTPGPSPTPTPNPNPKPTPTPQPDPGATLPAGEFDGLPRAVYAAARDLSTPTRSADCVALAEAAEGIAARVAAGTLRDRQTILNDMAAAIRERGEPWQPFSKRVGDRLKSLVYAGKLPTAERCAALLREAAVGLRAAAHD